MNLSLKTFLLVTLSSISLCSYSQSIDNSTLKEINYRLAQGAECRELQKSYQKQLVLDSSIIAGQQKIITNITTQKKDLQASNTLLHASLHEVWEKHDKQIKRKKFWKKTALLEGAFLIIILL